MRFVFILLTAMLFFSFSSFVFGDFIDDNCVVFYEMNDNSSNTVVIDSKNYQNATAQRNTDLMHTSGIIDGALAFNGVDDYLNTNNDFNEFFSNEFSISAWFKPDSLTRGTIWGTQVEISEGNLLTLCEVDKNAFCGFQIGNARNNVYAYGVVSNTTSWHQIVLVVKQQGSKIRSELYFDGVLQDYNITELDGNLSDYTSEAFDLWIGAQNDAGDLSFPFLGSIDNFRIFNKALSTEEVNSLYLLEKPTTIQTTSLIPFEVKSLFFVVCASVPIIFFFKIFDKVSTKEALLFFGLLLIGLLLCAVIINSL